MKKTTSCKVGHILPYEAIGGTEHATLRLARVMREAGYENTVFVLNGCEEISDFFRHEGFEVVFYQKIELSLRNPQVFWRESKKLAKIFSELNLNLIHCADYPIAAGISLAGFLSACPVISHVRNRHDSIQKRDKFLSKLIKHWIFVSKNTQQNFALKINDERTTILYDGIEIGETNESVKSLHRESVCREYGLDPDAKIIGTLARVAPQKDFFTLAKAVKRLIEKDKRIKVFVVGSISREEIHRQHYREVLNFLEEIGVARHFIFTDFQTETTRFLHAFDVFVLSTYYEGFPLVNLEAMAQKIPVVATAVDGVPEAIIDGETGLLYPPQNSDKLFRALEKLFDDPIYAKKIGDSGFRFTKNNFSSQKYAEDVLRIYRRILKLNEQDSAAKN